MEVKTIDENTVLCIVTMLQKSVPAISTVTLVNALKAYDETGGNGAPRCETCTVKEACTILGVSRPTVARLASEGFIRRINMGHGRGVRFDRSSVYDCLKNKDGQP